MVTENELLDLYEKLDKATEEAADWQQCYNAALLDQNEAKAKYHTRLGIMKHEVIRLRRLVAKLQLPWYKKLYYHLSGKEPNVEISRPLMQVK